MIGFTVFVALISNALAAATLGPCLFDGHQYQAGETIMIPHCLATMRCLGNNNLGDLKSLGGVCPDKRQVDGQSGCLFNGHVYAPGQKITIQPCLAEMTCEGHNLYSTPKSLGGVCPQNKREADGQTGCLFDGKVYAAGDEITIGNCLARMTCLGHNNLSNLVSLGGQC